MRFFIVADDMTGANVSNALLAKDGFKVGTLNHLNNIERYSDFEALGVHTESRALEASKAYQRVFDATSRLKDVNFSFMNKRIDSTLRGNIGAEIDGMLDALDEDTVAIVVPSFPDSQKIVIGNYMLVEGDLLEETDVAVDPTTPVTKSKVNTIISEQTDREIATISIQSVVLGVEEIQETLEASVRNGAKIVVIDAVSNAQIDAIARAVIQSDIPFVTVDPGPFTHAIAKVLDEEDVKKKQKVLFLVGSASPIMIEQIAHFRSEHDPYAIQIDARKLVDSDESDKEIERVVNGIIDNLENNQMFLAATIMKKEDRIDLKEVAKETGKTVREVSEEIVDKIALIGKTIMDEAKDEFGGVYTSGGDVLMAFLESASTVGIQIEDEIEPLTVFGKIMGGDLAGKAIVTKGGLVGNRQTVSHCASFISTKLSSEFY